MTNFKEFFNLIFVVLHRGPSRIKDMYDIEMSEAHKLIDDTKRDAAAASVKAQQAEQETQRQQERYNKVSSLREVDRKEIDAIQRKLAENQAVRFIILENSTSSNVF